MGFVKSGGADILGLGGSAAAQASRDSADIQASAGREAIVGQREAAERGQEFFAPFAGAAQRGVEASSFLANPQEQFEFLQNNPLFNLSLENANQRTLQSASANKRLSFGDTLQQLSNNTLLAASPLIDRQRQDVAGLLDLGTGIATSQANIETGKAASVGGILTDIGAAQAAGGVGAANAMTQGNQNLASMGIAAASMFSDERLKTNVEFKEIKDGNSWYTWDWSKVAGDVLGLFGSDEGVLAQEVIKTNPDAIVHDDSGYMKVNYGAL